MRKIPANIQHQIDALERAISERDPALVVLARSRLDERIREMTRPRFPVSPREVGIFHVHILRDIAAKLDG